MERIAGNVQRELVRLGPGGSIQDVVAVWPAAVGADIARNAWPARIARDGTLHVAVSSSTWAFELAHLAGTLVARLGELLTDPPARLRFAPGVLPEPLAAAGADNAPSLTPSPEASAEAEQLVAAIADPELREVVARAAAASLARAASDRRF
jgi:hypothetical protein